MGLRWLAFLALAVLAPVDRVRAQEGSLEVVARVTPTAAHSEPARALPLYLLRKCFAAIQKEAEEPEPKPDLERFIDGLQVSKELKAWMKRTHSIQLVGTGFQRRVTPDDLLAVPEFFKAYAARNAGDIAVGFPAPKYREHDREKNPQKYERQRQEYREAVRKFAEANPQNLEGIELFLADIDPSQRWTQLQVEHERRVHHRRLELAGTRYLVAKAETDLEGRATLAAPAGDYCLSTLEAEAAAGDARLRWDVPVTVRVGRVTQIELTNLNAVQPERSPP